LPGLDKETTMTTTLKSLAIFTALAGGAFFAQPAKADHVSVSLGFVVPGPTPVQRVYVAPAPVTTVYAAPSYSYSSYSYSTTTTYYAPTTTYYAPATTYYAPTYVPAPVVVTSPVYVSPRVIVSSPVYCPPPIRVGPLFPGLGINISFGGGHR
jgi:hypothetical protein